MFIFTLPSSVRRPGPEKLAFVPDTDPAVGVAWTIMLCASPNFGRTKAERPAIKHSQLPVAEPEGAKSTFMATCENEAVPPRVRWCPPAASAGTAEAATRGAA